MSDQDGTTIPFSQEAESAVIACLLNDSSLLGGVLDTLSPDDFYRPAHREIYGAMLALQDEGNPLDLLSVCIELNKRGTLSEAGGRSGVAEIACTNFVLSTSLPFYAKIVKRDSLRRRLLRGARKIADAACEDDDLDQSMALASHVVQEIDQLNVDPTPSEMLPLVNRVFDILHARHANQDSPESVTIGYAGIDALTAGFRAGELILVGARPAMGKTAFAMNIAYNVASGKRTVGGQQKRVAVFSLEMTKEALTERLLALSAGLDSQALKHGLLRDEDWQAVSDFGVELERLPIRIYDTNHGINTVRAIEAKARQQEQKGEPFELMIIDYISYLKGEGGRYENRTLEIEQIAVDLHNLAVRLGIPIIALCQLSRKVEERQNKRPMMADLRDSGALEQIADTCFFLYRDDYYNKESDARGEVEVILAKQRSGPCGTVELTMRIDTGRFFDKPDGPRQIGTPNKSGTRKYMTGSTSAEYQAGNN